MPEGPQMTKHNWHISLQMSGKQELHDTITGNRPNTLSNDLNVFDDLCFNAK